MREIKFRAWAVNSKKMLYNTSYPEPNSEAHSVLEYMQYTGLKDKNGVEIYEGDIVKTKYADDAKYIVEWSDYGCWWSLKNIPDVNSGNNLNGDGDDFEVIGNIYENPELLENK